ncbi:auxin-responsive protein IAA16-like [Hibiscus syriacus]|uniref:auxin-responsive protein IAA16-like n=1 Tax=Hibiscus syriacus TaxID=106335 RepID=UPI00192058C9|nr:auxin-responsive protein IAA16-like [Hibiscus syriacus]
MASDKTEEYPQLLTLNTMNKEWLVNHEVSEETKLELRLGPPGEVHGYNSNTIHGTKRAFHHTTAKTRIGEKAGDEVNSTPTPWSSGFTIYSGFQKDAKTEPQHSKASFFQNIPVSKKFAGMAEDFKQPSSSKMTLGEVQFSDRKARCTLSTADPDASTNNTSNKSSSCSLKMSRIAYSPVVGWPPVRSFRKNLASNSLSKPASETSNDKTDTGVKPENHKTQLFVKINMEGIPIGRKINLSAYNSYEELSLAIDELFSGLLAAQRDPSATQSESRIKELAKAGAGSLAGNGEYTLI